MTRPAARDHGSRVRTELMSDKLLEKVRGEGEFTRIVERMR